MNHLAVIQVWGLGGVHVDPLRRWDLRGQRLVGGSTGGHQIAGGRKRGKQNNDENNGKRERQTNKLADTDDAIGQ